MATDTFLPLAEDTRPAPTTPFERALHRFLDDFFAAYPVSASFSGFHLVDHRWGDFTEDGRRTRVAMLGRQRELFEGLDSERLSLAEHIDRGVLLEAIDQMVFEEDVLREPAWDPLSYVYIVGSGFFGLLAREYAPWAHRGGAFLERMRGLPAVFDAARANLVGHDGRPVSLLHTETALNQLSGITDLIDQALVEAGRRAEGGESPDLRDALEAEAPRAREAVDSFRRVLEEEVRGRAEGDGRMGADLFQQKLRHTLASDLSATELHQRAKRDYAVVRAEMVRLAREAWATWLPAETLPDTTDGAADDLEGTIVRRVLDAIAQDHRQPHELLEWCQEEVRRIEDFCRQRSIIGLPDDPLRITWTPVFMRAYGRAFLDSPGPLDKGQSSHFWITPPDETAGDEATESYLREDNDRMLKLLCIHEGVPGHYLQLAWSNRLGSLTRSIFASGMFAEGWAVYVTQVMMDLGYGDNEPALLLNHWKFYLRAITNAIMDVEIHTMGMTEEQAMELMVRGGFQEADEARAKWLRARLTSTQLSTYYLGSLEMWDLELEARRRAARRAGSGDEAVPEQRIVGGLGETPGFEYRPHLESVISYGTPPIKWVRRVLAEQADAVG
jgi:uncharacterized protein (DUF885 family)